MDINEKVMMNQAMSGQSSIDSDTFSGSSFTLTCSEISLAYVNKQTHG